MNHPSVILLAFANLREIDNRDTICSLCNFFIRRKVCLVVLFTGFFFSISFIKAKGAESKGEEGEAKGSEGTEGEAKGSEGATEDTGGGTKEDTGGTTQEGAKQEGENQAKNEEEAEGCCCVII